jgi:putative oxidoreductase
MHPLVSLIARILLSAIFIHSGFGKIMAYAATQAYREQHGVPGVLLPVVIAVELLGGLAVLFGIWSRYAGLILALFTLAAAAVFHNNFADQMQMINFMKNVAMAGGLLLLFANGSGRYAVRPD